MLHVLLTLYITEVSDWFITPCRWGPAPDEPVQTRPKFRVVARSHGSQSLSTHDRFGVEPAVYVSYHAHVNARVLS